MEEAFKDFLIGYVVAGHTVDDNVMNEMNELTNQFVDSLYAEYYFTSDATELFIDFLEENLSEENKHWFPLRYDKYRYIRTLEGWIKHLIESSIQ